VTQANVCVCDVMTVYLQMDMRRHKHLLCDQRVLDHIAEFVPSKPKPAGFNPYAAGAIGDPVAMITGIDIILDPNVEPGHWRLVLASDHNVVIEQGVLSD
jgi:hypothetical protein